MRALWLLAAVLLSLSASASYWQEQILTDQWQQYLASSAKLLQQDATALAAELQGKPVTTALKHKQFGLNGIDSEAEAEAVLSFQTPSGGWSKRTDMRIARQRGQQFGSASDYVPTFDNDATTSQLHWLADYYPKAAPQLQQRIAQAIARGVALVLQAQYPNGGFPQSFPLRGSYHDAVTLNDNALYQLMLLLWQVANEPRFAMLADSTKADAERAFYRAVDWLLANQVMVNGKRTVWGAQHHPLTGAPVAARKFEQVALVSSESAKLLQLLLHYAPDYPGVAQSLAAGASWLRQHQINNKARQRDAKGRLLLIDRPGSMIWARFYDINSGQPLFFDRDGQIYNDVSQLSLERQRGYGWYQSVAGEFLAEYNKMQP